MKRWDWRQTVPACELLLLLLLLLLGRCANYFLPDSGGAQMLEPLPQLLGLHAHEHAHAHEHLDEIR